MCGVFAPKTFGTRGFRPAAPRPRGARGHPPGLSRTQDWGSGSTPHLGGLRGGGTQRRARASAEQRLGSSSNLEKAAAAASPGSGAPGPDPFSPGDASGQPGPGSTHAHKPGGAPGNDAPGGPGRGAGGPRYSSLPPTPDPTPRAPPHYYIVTIFQAARIVILTLGRGPRVPTFEAGGAGGGGL